MFRSLFLADLARFYRNGLLPGLCWRLAGDWEIWLTYGGAAAAFFFFAWSPREIALLVFLVVFATCFYVVHTVVYVASPLCFGRFSLGRLTRRYTVPGRYPDYRADFISIPSAEPMTILNIATGTVGTTYVLLQHPDDPSVVLPLVDDNPRFMNHIMTFATAERYAEIAAEVDKLRQSDR
jgi:hypothetical protein